MHIKQLLIVQFSAISCYFPLRPNTFLGILFSITFSLRSSLDLRNQVSHQYKTTGHFISHTLTSIRNLYLMIVGIPTILCAIYLLVHAI